MKLKQLCLVVSLFISLLTTAQTDKLYCYISNISCKPTLKAGEKLVSANGNYTLQFNPQGNLQLTGKANKVLWQSNTLLNAKTKEDYYAKKWENISLNFSVELADGDGPRRIPFVPVLSINLPVKGKTDFKKIPASLGIPYDDGIYIKGLSKDYMYDHPCNLYLQVCDDGLLKVIYDHNGTKKIVWKSTILK